MPITFDVMAQHNLVYMQITGAVTIEDSLATLKLYTEHPEYTPGRRHLHDLSQVSLFRLEFKSVLSVQNYAIDQQQKSGSQNAVVYYAPSDLAYGIAKDIQQLWDAFPSVEVFITRTPQAALQLLDITDPQLLQRMEGTAPTRRPA